MTRLDRLEQVVRQLRTQRVGHQPFFFAFGHHYHGQCRFERLDLGQHVESARPGHVLVEQHAIQGLRANQRHGIGRVGGRNHVDSAPLEVENVGPQRLNFVVDP